MKWSMNIEYLGKNRDPSGFKKGLLIVPDGFVSSGGGLIAVGENEAYLHCFTASGDYLGVAKSKDPNHLYQHLLRLNCPDVARDGIRSEP